MKLFLIQTNDESEEETRRFFPLNQESVFSREIGAELSVKIREGKCSLIGSKDLTLRKCWMNCMPSLSENEGEWKKKVKKKNRISKAEFGRVLMLQME